MENYQNTQQAPVQAQEFAPAAPAKKKPAFMKFLPIVAIVVVAAILIGVFATGGPTAPVDDYLEVLYKGDASKIKKLAPNSVWEEVDLDEVKEAYAEAFEEETEDYGKCKKLDYEITDKEEIDKDDDEFEEIAEEVADSFEVDEDDVKKIYYIEVEGVAEYEEEEEEFEEGFYSVKIKGTWYLVHESGMPAYAGIVMIAAFYGADM